MIYPDRNYPKKLYTANGDELGYSGCGSNPYLGHYYTYYKDVDGNSITIVFFADYEIITPGFSYEKDRILTRK